MKDGEDNLIAEYDYDPFGHRIWKEVEGVRTYFVSAAEGLISEYDDSGVEIKGYGYRPNSMWTTNPLFQKTNGSYYWYQTDHLGTPQKLIDSQGNVVWAAVYEAFGKARVDVDLVDNHLRFAGQYFDAETGLHYNQYRYYEPDIGRYLRLDPIPSVNLYAYVLGNPVSFVDPFGLKVEFVIKNPNYPFEVKPKEVLKLAIRQIINNPDIMDFFNELLSQKGKTIEDLLGEETELYCPIKINKDSFLTWLSSFISTPSRGQTRWDGVFTKEPWPNQPNKSIALSLSLFSVETPMGESAALLIHELAHWIEAYALGEIAEQHPGYYDTGNYVESLIKPEYYEKKEKLDKK